MGAIITTSGSTKNTQKFLKAMESAEFASSLENFGQLGVNALAAVTPVETGETAAMWGYQVVSTPGGAKVQWTNDNIEEGVNVAVLIQYGHGTGTGGYISGIDYINPVMGPIFAAILEDLWKKVTTA